MKRKGISPLIAAVLLIAFTMAVASLFAQWAPQLIQNAQGNTLNESSNIQECSQYNIEIRNPGPNQTSVKQVRGPEGIGNLSVTWYYEDDEPIQNYTQITNAAGIATAYADPSADASLDMLEVQSLDCDEVATEYPPGQTSN